MWKNTFYTYTCSKKGPYKRFRHGAHGLGHALDDVLGTLDGARHQPVHDAGNQEHQEDQRHDGTHDGGVEVGDDAFVIAPGRIRRQRRTPAAFAPAPPTQLVFTSVIASAAKQSPDDCAKLRRLPRRCAPRNDGSCVAGVIQRKSCRHCEPEGRGKPEKIKQELNSGICVFDKNFQ